MSFSAVRDAPRQRHAARADADERQIARPAVAFEDFVGDSREGAGHPVRVHDLRHGHHLFAASRDRS